MFRVEKEAAEQKTRITISGEVSLACVELVEACCEEAIRDGKAVEVVLDVTTIDESGRALLERLAAKGVNLVAKGVYHAYLVEAILTAASGDWLRSDPRSAPRLPSDGK